jgi:hypothetical protein
MVDLNTNGARASGRWTGPIPCPPRTSGPIPLNSPTRVTEDVNALEAAALLRAFDAGNASLRASQPIVDAANNEMIGKWSTAMAAVDVIVRLRSVRAVAAASRDQTSVIQEHANDGPEDRRRRPMWKPMIWIILGIAAVFDASFVGNVMQRILHVGPHQVMYWLAYLPGVGLAMCLLGSGTMLAEHLFRRRTRIARRLSLPRLNPLIVLRRVFWAWRPEEVTRAENDLPWSRLFAPLLFLGATLGLLGVLAYVRAAIAPDVGVLADMEPAFVVLLMLLSIAAITVKVLAHNPYADRSERSAQSLKKITAVARTAVDRARQRASEHAQSWNLLQSSIAASEGRAREVVEAACADILESRGHKGVKGSIELPLVYLRWPGRDSDVDSQLPNLNLEILDYARDRAADMSPATLETRLEAEVSALHAQFDTTGSGSPAQPGG